MRVLFSLRLLRFGEGTELEEVRANIAAEDRDRLSDEELIGQMSYVAIFVLCRRQTKVLH